MHQLFREKPLRRTGDTLFSLRDVGYRYPNGQLALHNVSIDIMPGDRVAIVGQNGAGKSTLLKHLNGLLKPQSGELHYKATAFGPKHLRQARLEIGLLFQDPDDQLFCNSVEEDVLFGPLNQGLDLESAKFHAASALNDVGLSERKKRPPHRLSYGQRKRAALAGLLAMRPDVLLLDEPTANLDPQQEEMLLRRLKEFPGTMVCVTHNLLFAYELCERAIVLDGGSVQHDYSLRELVSHRESLREHGLDFSFRFVEKTLGDEPHQASGSGFSVPSGPVKDSTRVTIELHNYGYTYPDGTQALKGLDLSVEAGERLAIVGENGAGKSTLLSCLAGLREGMGSYRLGSKVVNSRNRKEICRTVGMVFQDSSDQLFCPTCYEEVAFGPRQLGLPKAEIHARVEQALMQVALPGYEQRVPLNLSGGERKRIALAAVLAMRPDVLFLDEPTSGLDPDGEERLLEILENLDVTLILVSHDLFFVRRLTTRTLVLHEGALMRDYSTEDFFNDANLTSLNQVDFTYRIRCGLEIMQLQHQHRHSHRHLHRHEHEHRHGGLVHSHEHVHVHEHEHDYTHTHHDHPAEATPPTDHGHLPRPDKPHDHDHPNHEDEPHDHEHE